MVFSVAMMIAMKDIVVHKVRIDLLMNNILNNLAHFDNMRNWSIIGSNCLVFLLV